MRKVAATFCVFFSTYSVAATDAFKAGVDAFQQAEFESALIHFEKAKTEGNESLQLTFNLGSTYYKLNRFAQAEQYFRSLLQEGKWRDLALINLGLIAEKRQNESLAQHYFVLAYESTTNPTLREIAARKINSHYRADQTRTFKSNASVFIGHDDNAIAFADDLQSNSNAVKDNFAEIYFLGQKLLNVGSENKLSTQGFAYKKAYQDFNSLNVDVVGFSLNREPSTNSFDQGLSLISAAVDNEIAYHQIQLNIGRPIDVGRSRWYVAFEPSYFIGGSDFDQLQGWRQRFTGARYWQWDEHSWLLTFIGEINDRENLRVGDSRYSYSPTRLGVSSRWDWDISSVLSFSTTVEVKASRYSGKNRLEDLDGEIKIKNRSGNKIQLESELVYLLDKHWSVTGKFQHVTVNENFDLYTYSRNQILLGLIFNY